MERRIGEEGERKRGDFYRLSSWDEIRERERERRAGFESAGSCVATESIPCGPQRVLPTSRCVSHQDQSGMGTVPLPATYETRRPPSWWCCFRWACIARESEEKGWFAVGVTDARGRRRRKYVIVWLMERAY